MKESAPEAKKKLYQKFNHLNVRNVNKRIKQRDDKITTCKIQIKALEEEVDKKSEIIEQFKKDCQ